MIRIGNGQDGRPDWPEAPVSLIEQEPLDYLTFDCVGVARLARLERRRRNAPEFGYAREFPPLAARIARRIRERGVRVLTNAGGANPADCAREVRRLAPALRIAFVTGDSILDQLDVLLAAGHELCSLDTGEPLASIRGRILSAHVFMGAFPLAEALSTGADVVIAGCAAGADLALGAMIRHFGWTPGDHGLLAAGAVAGHVIAIGARAGGGAGESGLGCPIAEVDPDGCFTITRHKCAGGHAGVNAAKERLLYGIGDPRRVPAADCTADITGVRLDGAGVDRVRVTGVRGGPPPEPRAAIGYHYGWKAVATLVYRPPRAAETARAAADILRARLLELGTEFEATRCELLGAGGCPEPPSGMAPDAAGVRIWAAVRAPGRAAAGRFVQEVIPEALRGPAAAAGFAAPPRVREIIAEWRTRAPHGAASPHVEVLQ